MRLPAGERRRQLLDVTKRLVGERGFHGVSIEAIARAAGVSRPIVYAHFGDLVAVFEALVDRELARALDQLQRVLPAGLEGAHAVAEQLVTALGAYLDVVAADPVTWRLVLMPPEGAPEVLRERIAAGRAVVVAQLAAVARGGSGWSSPDPELTARALSAVADEAARLVLTDPRTYSRERMLAHARWVLGEAAAKMA